MRAASANPSFFRPAFLETIAEEVRRARGPSGVNLEYVLRLSEALRAFGAEDEHGFALERLLVKGRALSPG